MPAPTTTQSWVRTRDVARIHVAFRQVQRRRRSGLKPPFAALLVGLCTPRPTLRPRSRDRQRTAWGRYGSLDLISSETFTPYSLPVSPAHLDMWLRHSAPSVRPSFLFYSVVVVIAVGTVGEWRGGIARPRSLRTVREPLDSYGSRPPASYSKGCPMGKECGLTSSDAMDPSLCISGTTLETLVLAHDPSR